MCVAKRRYPIIAGGCVGMLPQLTLCRSCLRVRRGQIENFKSQCQLNGRMIGGSDIQRPGIDARGSVPGNRQRDPGGFELLSFDRRGFALMDHVRISDDGSFRIPAADIGERFPQPADINIFRADAVIAAAEIIAADFHLLQWLTACPDRDFSVQHIVLPDGVRPLAEIGLADRRIIRLQSMAVRGVEDGAHRPIRFCRGFSQYSLRTGGACPKQGKGEA